MGEKKSFEELLKSLAEVKYDVNFDKGLEELENIPKIILGKSIDSILEQDKEGAKKYLKAYKKFSEGCFEGLDHVNRKMNEDYSFIRETFWNLKDRGYFNFNGEGDEKSPN